MYQILIKETEAELASFAAELFIEIAASSIADRGSFSVALSGGTTPRSLYTILASAYRDKLDWGVARFFFGDERNVPAESPDSNYRMASDSLLEPLGIDPGKVVRWRTELGVTAAAAEYQQHIEGSAPLDLVLLGLGADAHTASLFPNTNALKETTKLAASNWVEKLNDYRLTMTFPAINRSTNVMFVVAGGEKAEAMRLVLESEFRPDEYPAQMVQPENGQLFWLIDRRAASRLARV